MRIEHLFKNIFNYQESLVFKAPEKPQPVEAATQKLKPREMRRELVNIAQRHIDAAQDVVRDVERAHAERPLSKRAQQQLAKVKAHVRRLRAALRGGSNQTLAKTLSRSAQVMQENVGEGLQPYIEGREEAGDPLSTGWVSYMPGSYESRVRGTESVAYAKETLFDAVLQGWARTQGELYSSVNEALDMRYNRELTELAAARQLLRNRGEVPEEGIDSNLALARELHDTMLLLDAARGNKYVQERPEAIVARGARLIDRFLRTTGAEKLKRGGVLDLGYVVIQRSKRGEAYMLAYAEGTRVEGKPIAIPVTTIIDVGFEKQKTSLDSQIAKTERAMERAYRRASKLAEGTASQRQVDQAYAVHDRLDTKLVKLQEERAELEPVDASDFSSKATENASQVAERMYKDLEGIRAG